MQSLFKVNVIYYGNVDYKYSTFPHSFIQYLLTLFRNYIESSLPLTLRTVAPFSPHHCNSVYEQKIQQNIATFLHATYFSPVSQTFIKFINAGFFYSWPGFTTTLISKHLPPSEATTFGNLDQTRKYVRSTHIYAQDSTTQQLASSISLTESTMKTNIVFVSNMNPSKLVYSDLTGYFPVKSSRGNQCVSFCTTTTSTPSTSNPYEVGEGPLS